MKTHNNLFKQLNRSGLMMSIIMLVFLLGSCTNIDDDPAPECEYTTYTGGGSCSTSDGIPVTSNVCCPAGYPYYCSNTNRCWASCESARDNCGSTPVIFGTSSGGGGGTCNYSTYTGGGSCSTPGYVRVSSSTCCPGTSPYYCTATASCYPSCEAANSNCAMGAVIKGSSGGGSGTTCAWSTWQTYGQIITNKFTNICGNNNDHSVKIKNISNIKVDIRICIKRADGTWDCGSEWDVSPGQTMSYWTCNGAGSMKYYIRPSSVSWSDCPYPNP